MAATGAGTYEERIAKFGLASLDEVAAAAANPDVVYLDIRSGALPLTARVLMQVSHS